MKNITLKTAGLLILALFGTQALASSPWADDPAPNETSAEESPIGAPTESEAELVVEDSTGRPGMDEEEIIVPVMATQDEVTDEEVEEAVTETVQTEGDVLNVEPNPQIASVRLLDFPRRGMTTDKVKNELGDPAEIISPIGEPPISRWIYNDRTVYFEHTSVIHVVAR